MAFSDCPSVLDCETAKLSFEQLFKRHLLTIGEDGCLMIKTSATLTSGSGEDFELRKSTYKANTAGTGYSIGDYIQRVDIINVTTPGVVSSLWFNETTGLAIVSAPTQAHIDPFTEPISIGDGGSVSLGAKADTSATTDSGTFSLIALFKRLLEKFTAGINTGGFTEKLSLSITTSATAYTANDNIGGIQTLSNILRTSGGTAILNGISLWALGNQKPNLYIDFFDASPSNGTYTNDAAQIISGDHAAWLGRLEVAAADWQDTGVISRCTKTGLGIILKGNASRNIYMTIQDKTGVTFSSTAGLFIKVGALQD